MSVFSLEGTKPLLKVWSRSATASVPHIRLRRVVVENRSLLRSEVGRPRSYSTGLPGARVAPPLTPPGPPGTPPFTSVSYTPPPLREMEPEPSVDAHKDKASVIIDVIAADVALPGVEPLERRIAGSPIAPLEDEGAEEVADVFFVAATSEKSLVLDVAEDEESTAVDSEVIVPELTGPAEEIFNAMRTGDIASYAHLWPRYQEVMQKKNAAGMQSTGKRVLSAGLEGACPGSTAVALLLQLLSRTPVAARAGVSVAALVGVFGPSLLRSFSQPLTQEIAHLKLLNQGAELLQRYAGEESRVEQRADIMRRLDALKKRGGRVIGHTLRDTMLRRLEIALREVNAALCSSGALTLLTNLYFQTAGSLLPFFVEPLAIVAFFLTITLLRWLIFTPRNLKKMNAQLKKRQGSAAILVQRCRDALEPDGVADMV